MNFVQPIRDPALVKEIEAFLKGKHENGDRDHILFLLGIYTALRVSDILRLRVKDLKDKSYLILKEKKTKKERRIDLNPALKRALKKYLKDKLAHEYVIKSRNGKNKAITRERAYAILREAGEEFDLDAIGTHTMRKTFGYHMYNQTKDVALVQSILNHSSPSITLQYIGINQDSMDRAIHDFKYY